MSSWFVQKFFWDPTQTLLKKYKKELFLIHKERDIFRKEIQTEKDILEKTEELKILSLKENVWKKDERKNLYKAIALHLRACEIIFEKEFLLENENIYIWNMIPYDVQVLGALSLYDGNISEMKTGEGKTLVATISAYAQAIQWDNVHIVTVNDYLAKRDSQEMGVILKTLGMKVGCITHNQDFSEKKEAYTSDVVYATNNELGFDYLRDNMATKPEQVVMSHLSYAIIDEVDSILIDEARTPLIISSPDGESTMKYFEFKKIAERLQSDAYKIDEKSKTVTLTEKGIEDIENILGIKNIFSSNHFNDIYHIENALKAKYAYIVDIDYIVRDGQVMIIDEHTGRVLSGRRYSQWLHQALEAKEGVDIQQESKTLASITFQNLFRLYKKLSGMTGTAKTEEEEFQKIYGLDVIVMPTNKPIIRQDLPDQLFKSEKGKFDFLVEEISSIHKDGRPVLVGTVSVQKSEYLSRLLTQKGVSHEVLNAKQDMREAEIITKAGQKNAVTIATNMAGRGTDIKLGEWVVELGGLYVIGTEKHETRRIDNQLRWRSGRQGDPGTTQFLISPQDDIMRVFGGEKLFSLFNGPMFASYPEDQPLIRSRMLSRQILNVQKQIEGRNFDIRKHILEYDDILNEHRKIIYTKRKKIRDSQSNEELEDIHHNTLEILQNEINGLILKNEDGEIDAERTEKNISDFIQTSFSCKEKNIDTVQKEVFEIISSSFPLKDTEKWYNFERRLYLLSIDQLWMEHIDAMTQLREDVAFAGYANKNPLLIYQGKAFEAFEELIKKIYYRYIKGLITSVKDMYIEQESINIIHLKEGFDTRSTEKNKNKKNEEKKSPGLWVLRINQDPNINIAKNENKKISKKKRKKLEQKNKK